MREGETPVPIPNTTVKTFTADGTMRATAWESRWLPDIFIYNNSTLDELLTKITPETETKQRFISIFGGVAQVGEHLPCKQGVMSSNLTISTRSFPKEMITAERSAAGTLKTEYRQANID